MSAMKNRATSAMLYVAVFTFMPDAFPVFTPPYEYTMDPVGEVQAIVTAGAGNVNAT
jgi:hypothetical protein